MPTQANTKGTPETRQEERCALMDDIHHLQKQSERYGSAQNDDCEVGGIKGVLLREKRKLFDILLKMD
jgi:hypothetical protein